MNTTLPIAPAAPLPTATLQAMAPDFTEDTPPWDFDAESERPAPARKVIRRASSDTGRIVAEPIPWPVVAMTVLTALFIALSAGTSADAGSRVMTFASAEAAD